MVDKGLREGFFLDIILGVVGAVIVAQCESHAAGRIVEG